MRGAGPLAASDARPGPARRVHLDRRGVRPDRAARRGSSPGLQAGAGWRDDGRDVYVSVNVSPLQLAHGDMVSVVGMRSRQPACRHRGSASSSARPRCSRIPSPARDAPGAQAPRRQLVIDDFGGGSSSFALLRTLPIDLIKIDQVFIDGLPDARRPRHRRGGALARGGARADRDRRGRGDRAPALGAPRARLPLLAGLPLRPAPAARRARPRRLLARAPARRLGSDQIREFMRQISDPSEVEAGPYA